MEEALKRVRIDRFRNCSAVEKLTQQPPFIFLTWFFFKLKFWVDSWWWVAHSHKKKILHA